MVGACNQHLFIILQLFYVYVQAFRAFFFFKFAISTVIYVSTSKEACP